MGPPHEDVFARCRPAGTGAEFRTSLRCPCPQTRSRLSARLAAQGIGRRGRSRTLVPRSTERNIAAGGGCQREPRYGLPGPLRRIERRFHARRNDGSSGRTGGTGPLAQCHGGGRLNAREFLKPLDLIDGRKLWSLAGLHAADTLACLAAGAGTLEGRALAVFYAGSGLCEPFASAAAAAAIIRLTEWDDIHVPSCVTPGSVAVPVALVLARDDAEFAASVCAGYGVGVALGEAVGGVSALPETWPGLFAAPAIAAVTASTALGLSAEKRAHALVMALAGSSGR